jgi:hypothetical protein
MPGHSRSQNGVASLAYVPGIHVFLQRGKDVDGRDKPGHDANGKDAGQREPQIFFASAGGTNSAPLGTKSLV